ncbi:Gamma-secretase-activating protein [Merluccius polli]|uniref:Gamma-secretase-activating protein n=1 Tax=Merluccius polli TaxID=89951 RepID=A0AA47M0H1_MERPO|nr:Gamma-secretase-activating protein [Merluccius polli]
MCDYNPIFLSGVHMCNTMGSSSEWSVFHFMCRVLEATRGLCLPLPPGYNTMLSVLGVRCLPHHSFLQYVDHGLLQLTETLVTRLMTGTYTHSYTHSLTHSL